MTALLEAHGLTLRAPAGRVLVRDLSLCLERGERVAVVGRNGVGKSSLLAALAGHAPVERGRVVRHGACAFVPQLLAGAPEAGMSPGAFRRQRLQRARMQAPDLLLLDEPTHDLDERAIEWLRGWLSAFRGGLVLVSHDRRMLRLFDDFFVIAESGCRHYAGDFDGLVAELEAERAAQQLRYVRNLQRLEARERQNDAVARRRQRKKNLGRIHELKRCPSRAKLNQNRAYAQESQGKRALLQAERIEAARTWVQATRRALTVALPLSFGLPQLPAPRGLPIVSLKGATLERGGRRLVEGLSLSIERDRVGVVGDNGAGKSTLLETLVGERAPTRGSARQEPERLGYVAQNADNFQGRQSLLERLLASGHTDVEHVARVLQAHGFPFALADRPLMGLSPGERLRAALICLCQRPDAPELLVLDEPTDHLDLVGLAALERLLSAWPGGLVVVSHDREFLARIGLHRTLGLPMAGPKADTRSAL